MTKKTKHKNLVFKTGVVMLVASMVVWLGAFIVPFLQLPTDTKVATTTAMLIVVEVAFWIGAIMTGKDFIQQCKKLQSQSE
jgi:hypothetical protein